MKHLILVFLIMVAQHSFAQKTPLLDRELFFGNPEISGGQLSPDGMYLTFMKAHKGIMNIWIKKIDEPFEQARPLTDSQRPLYGYFWTDDSKYILYVKDKDGDENINIFAVDPSTPNNPETGIPDSRNLTPLKDVTAQIYSVSRINPDKLKIGLNDRDKAWHDLYELTISTGELNLLHKNETRITGYDFDWDEKLRLLYQTDEKGNTSFLYYGKNNKLVPIYKTRVTETAYVNNWNEDNTKFYLVTNVGSLDKSTLYLMDPLTKRLELIESDPENKVDFGDLRMDRNTRKIISTSYTLDKTKYYWKDKEWEKMYKHLQKQFKNREVDFQSSTKDYSKFLIAVGGDKYASEAYFYDAKTKQLIHQYTPRPKLKEVEKHLAPMTSLTYLSSDKLEIPAYLTLPVGVSAKNLPVVVLVHGGPKGPRDNWGYNATVQFLANRGYAVLQPNFRASGGYGKKFLNAGDLQWGKLMQDDITYGVKHLIEKGIADKNKVAIMGGSYGGYATLAGLAFTPDVYACGVDIVGPSNIFTLLESIPPYWEAGRAFLHGMVGDPNTEKGKKLIKAASPLFSVDKIVKPLMIIQGANDPRVKQAESDQIVIALRDKGKKVDYLLAADEGHGFAKPLNNKAMYASIEKFLAEVIGGRYQEDMADDVKESLAKLIVDVKTVKYTPKPKVDIAKALPAIQNSLSEGTYKYDMAIDFSGQKLNMDVTRTISLKDGNYVIHDMAKGAMGESMDEITITPDFRPISRTLGQMGQNISLVYEDQKATADMNGQKMEMKFSGAYFNDGPGSEYVIAGLPLAEGYTIYVEMPDMTTMKTKKVEVKCLGRENVNNVDCQIVEVKNIENENDKITYWINPQSKDAEKMVQVVPAMQNASITITKK